MGRKRDQCVMAIAWGTMLRELMAGPTTALELVAATGLQHDTVLGYIRVLRRMRVVRVASWDADTRGRRGVAAYALGDGPDARRAPMAPIDIKRAYRKRCAQRAADRALGGIAA